MSSERETPVNPSIACNGSITNIQQLKPSLVPEIRSREHSTTSPSTSLSHLSKPDKLEANPMSSATEPCKNVKEQLDKVGVNQMKTQTPKKPFANGSCSQDKARSKVTNVKETVSSKEQVNTVSSKVASEGVSNAGINDKQCVRPINPFAKSPSNQDKSSLIDSIKKMRKAEQEKNERGKSKKAKV